MIALKHTSTLKATQAESTSLDETDREEQLQHLSHALEALPDRERLAVHLHFLESDPVAMAREAMGISRSGYYKLLARAKQQLAALMQDRTTISERIATEIQS